MEDIDNPQMTEALQVCVGYMHVVYISLQNTSLACASGTRSACRGILFLFQFFIARPLEHLILSPKQETMHPVYANSLDL